MAGQLKPLRCFAVALAALFAAPAAAQAPVPLSCSIDDLEARMEGSDRLEDLAPGRRSFTVEWTPAHVSGRQPRRVYHAAELAIDLPHLPFVFYRYDELLWGAHSAEEALMPLLFGDVPKRPPRGIERGQSIADAAAEIGIAGDYVSHQASMRMTEDGASSYRYLLTFRHVLESSLYKDVVITGRCAPAAPGPSPAPR